MGRDLEKIAAENVAALFKSRWPDPFFKPPYVLMEKQSKIGRSTLHRIFSATPANPAPKMTLEIIEKLAAYFELEPWQMLIPDLNPKAPPILADVAERERALIRRLHVAIRPERATAVHFDDLGSAVDDSLTVSPEAFEPRRKGERRQN